MSIKNNELKTTKEFMEEYLPLLCRDYYVHKSSLIRLNPFIFSEAKWHIYRNSIIVPSKYLRSIYLFVESNVCYEIGTL